MNAGRLWSVINMFMCEKPWPYSKPLVNFFQLFLNLTIDSLKHAITEKILTDNYIDLRVALSIFLRNRTSFLNSVGNSPLIRNYLFKTVENGR